MKAIILAAGESKRLYPLTLEKPKCLLEIEPGKTIIEHQVDIFGRCGIKDIVVVTGFLKEKIKDVLKNRVRYRNFKDYSMYNNLHTLYHIKDELNEEVVILYSDVVFGKNLLRKCLDSKEDFCMLVHNKNILKDTTRVKIKNNGIVEVGNHIPVDNAEGNFVGIAKFSKKGAKILAKEMRKLVKDKKHDNSYYIATLTEIAKKMRVSYQFIEDEPWIEIDFLGYYKKAKKEIYPLVK